MNALIKMTEDLTAQNLHLRKQLTDLTDKFEQQMYPVEWLQKQI
jgi:hypothetical protein